MKLSRKSAKRGDAAPASRSSAKGKPKPSSLGQPWIIAFLVAALIVAVIALVLFRQMNEASIRLKQEQVSAVAERHATELAAMIAGYARNMAYASERGRVRAAAAAGAASPDVRRAESDLDALFPGALRVLILPAGVDTPDDSLTPPLGYACLDLLQQTAASLRTSKAEVHRFGSDSEHIDLVHPIVDDATAELQGHLLVTLPVSQITDAVKSMRVRGELSLVQIGGGARVVLARSGSTRGKDEAKTVPVRGTAWHVVYRPPVGGELVGLTPTVFWALFGIALLLLAALLWALSRRQAKAYLEDQVTIIRLFKDAQNGRLAAAYPARLKDSRPLLDQLTHMVREAGPPRATRAKAEAPPTPAPIDSDLSTEALQVEEVNLAPRVDLDPSIFRAYDIRGIVDTGLTAAAVYEIGRAIGSEAYERGEQQVVVARDGRLSGPELSASLTQGLTASGRNVIDVGRVPTPVLYFATQYLGSGSGVMLTGSHNPANYNGLKIMLRGETLHGEGIQRLRHRIEGGKLLSGDGKVEQVDVATAYVERITSDVQLMRPLKVVVDCGNGVTGELGPRLLRELGCEVVEMFCEIDGNFPNHHPDPGKPENLIALSRAVPEQNADLGLAFDGDGDRLGVVDSAGKIIWPDRVLMLLATDVLLRQPGAKIIYDVKCSRHLDRIIRENGGEPQMGQTGHSFIKAQMKETGALLAGEMSGHIFFKERWFGFDDALYAAARLLEVLAAEKRPSSAVFDELPDAVTTPELNVAMKEGEHFELMQRLLASAQFPGAKLITIDGLRAEFPDGWGLVRASNTTPCLVLRFEADDAEALHRIQEEFRRQLLDLNPDLKLPF